MSQKLQLKRNYNIYNTKDEALDYIEQNYNNFDDGEIVLFRYKDADNGIKTIISIIGVDNTDNNKTYTVFESLDEVKIESSNGVNISNKEGEKNFLENDKDGYGLKVTSIDTDCTVITDRILVAGGPLDSAALREILPKDEAGNAYIESKTDIQSLLLNLFRKIEWPSPKITEGKINTTISAPTFTLTNGDEDATNKTYEVGTVLTMSDVTLSKVSNSTTSRTCSEFTYGYASEVNGEITKTKKIEIQATNVTVNNDNYTMSRDFTKFTNTDDTAISSTVASAVTLAGADCILQEGECSIKVSVQGPKGECTFKEIPSYYIVSNIGTLDSGHTSPTKAETIIKEDTTPSNSKTIKVNGVRYGFYGCVDDTFVLNNDNIRGLSGKLTGGSLTNSFTIVGSNVQKVIVALPTSWGKKISKVIANKQQSAPITDAYEEQTSQIAINGANNFQAENYIIYIFDPETVIEVEDVITLTNK